MSTTKLWKTDDELFALVQRELFTCVVGDVMDKIDLQHQFLPPQIQPIRRDMVVIGRAMPVLSVDVFAERTSGSANPLMNKSFGLMLEALDDLRRNEVYVNTGSSPRNALWGELMSTRARKLGSRGAVLNGYVRDTKTILEMGFPTFGFGSYGQDSARSKKREVKSWCARPLKKEVVRWRRSRSTESCKQTTFREEGQASHDQHRSYREVDSDYRRFRRDCRAHRAEADGERRNAGADRY